MLDMINLFEQIRSPNSKLGITYYPNSIELCAHWEASDAKKRDVYEGEPADRQIRQTQTNSFIVVILTELQYWLAILIESKVFNDGEFTCYNKAQQKLSWNIFLTWLSPYLLLLLVFIFGILCFFLWRIINCFLCLLFSLLLHIEVNTVNVQHYSYMA